MILCGSNSSWIKNKIFEDSNGPLYQRLTEKIHLKPFDLKETIDILIEYTNNVYEIVECKFYNNDEFEITDKYKKNILNKINIFSKYGTKGKFELKFAMLTSYGCKKIVISIVYQFVMI